MQMHVLKSIRLSATSFTYTNTGIAQHPTQLLTIRHSEQRGEESWNEEWDGEVLEI